MTAKSSYKDLLKNIKDLKARDRVSVYMPTSGNTEVFTPLTVKQQKDILSSGVDTEIENLTFANITNAIIKENQQSSQKILITDKPLILLQLRKHACGSELIVEEGDEKHIVNLDQHISQCKNIKSYKQEFEITHDVIKIQGQIPDLDKDTTFNKQFTKNVKKGKTKLKINDVIGDIYVTELVKYIDTISIDDNIIKYGEGVTAENMIEIFENLPLQVSTALANEVKDLREVENECLNSSQLPENIRITIRASLFTAAE